MNNSRKRKVGEMDPKPPADLLAPLRINLNEAEILWKNDIWRWYLSYRLSQDDAYLQILK
jgi:hypothetical protein